MHFEIESTTPLTFTLLKRFLQTINMKSYNNVTGFLKKFDLLDFTYTNNNDYLSSEKNI